MDEHSLSGNSNSDLGQLHEKFEILQRKLAPMWQDIGRQDPGGPIEKANTPVIVPSLTVDVEQPIIQQQAYEERFLFLIFLLKQPQIRLIYVTSLPVNPNIVDYYLDLLPGVVASSARKRLFLVSPNDGSPRPLTEKLLERPQLIAHIRSLIPDLDRAHMVPFNTTDLERELTVRLGIPMYAADPRFFAFGTKSGSRRIFAEEGVAHPAGYNDLFSEAQIVESIAKIMDQEPGLPGVVAKLNEGVGGMGNAFVDLSNFSSAGSDEARKFFAARLRQMRFEVKISYEDYIGKVEDGGAIVEALIQGDDLRSPSAQLRVTPGGEVQMLSTHDQLLGGPSGQSYLGARFPANQAYSWMIMKEALKIGTRLASEGIVGRFAVDFVVIKDSEGKWQAYAIEVNLRKGGTTAPYLTLQYLTDGMYDQRTGTFLTAHGHPRCYVSSDHVMSDDYRAFTVEHLFDTVTNHRLHFDHTRQCGVVLHMMSAIGGYGEFGVTAIAATPLEAQELYDKLLTVLATETGESQQS